jgi:hypothetical protein
MQLEANRLQLQRKYPDNNQEADRFVCINVLLYPFND